MFKGLKKHVKHYRKAYCWLLLFLLCCAFVLKKAGEYEATRLECTVTKLPQEALPGCGPLRIALLADVHNNSRLFYQAIGQIEKAKPDLIIFGGDLVMVTERFMRTRWAVNGFKRLGKVAPCFAILGNQDYEKQEQVERVLGAAGIPLIRNFAVDWQTPSGAPLRIVGLGDWNEGDELPQYCLKKAGEEKQAVLLLSHDPESRWLLRRYAWNLMLSGHTHAGQIGIPFTDRYISMRSSMPAGLYDFEGGRRVFVTRGVGSILNMRFFCRPEVSIIDIGEPAQ